MACTVRIMAKGDNVVKLTKRQQEVVTTLQRGGFISWRVDRFTRRYRLSGNGVSAPIQQVTINKLVEKGVISETQWGYQLTDAGKAWRKGITL